MPGHARPTSTSVPGNLRAKLNTCSGKPPPGYRPTCDFLPMVFPPAEKSLPVRRKNRRIACDRQAVPLNQQCEPWYFEDAWPRGLSSGAQGAIRARRHGWQRSHPHRKRDRPVTNRGRRPPVAMRRSADRSLPVFDSPRFPRPVTALHPHAMSCNSLRLNNYLRSGLTILHM